MDLAEHLKRQIAFSRATFGPGARTERVSDHIRKELEEVGKATSHIERAKEWVDLVILSLDGLTRCLVFEAGDSTDEAAEDAVALIRAKQTRNEERVWPDWRTADPNKAIEHDRSGEAPATAGRVTDNRDHGAYGDL